MIFAGIDVGSMSAEAVLMEDNTLLAASIIVVEPNPVRSAELVMQKVLQETGLSHENIAFCVSTGYGRERIPYAQQNVSEISCHGKGAFWANDKIRTIIDVGGQDLKVITVNAQGDMEDFIMNDKCAAGTGRFLEGIAKVFGTHVSELGPMALAGAVPVPISSICTVFTQFDVMGFIAEGKSKEDVALGVSEALATRINRLVARLDVQNEICITGGVSKNNSVVKSLEKVMGRHISPLPVDPQIVGALGAAVFARNRYLKIHPQAGQECH